jgi:hypothetical protein
VSSPIVVSHIYFYLRNKKLIEIPPLKANVAEQNGGPNDVETLVWCGNRPCLDSGYMPEGGNACMQEMAQKVSKRYKEKTGIKPEIYVCKIPDGGGELEIIVI